MLLGYLTLAEVYADAMENPCNDVVKSSVTKPAGMAELSLNKVTILSY
jgi:putative transposase